MVEGLVLGRAHFGRNGVPPFLTVGEFRIHVEDDATERKDLVANDFTNAKFCVALFHGLHFLSP